MEFSEKSGSEAGSDPDSTLIQFIDLLESQAREMDALDWGVDVSSLRKWASELRLRLSGSKLFDSLGSS
ncbi:MAG: hypothetical protein LLG06_16980 [Desulfobacteraceae bacterium]|nr:hypothetical protein [Desulfobacteraceae bacterium]